MVVLAEKLGFCFGVNKAVEKARELLSRRNDTDNSKIYLLGNLVNNRRVVDEFLLAGAVVINNAEDAEDGSTVIIRAHGVGEDVYTLMEQRNIRIVDMTCANVKKIHKIVKDRYFSGHEIVIIGQKTHAEVIGINGWCGNSAILIEDDSDINTFLSGIIPDRICVVCQTTFSREKWDCFTRLIKTAPAETEIVDTLCGVTKEIQRSAISMAAAVDAIVVIGDPSSKNSNELFSICKSVCASTYMVNSLSDIAIHNEIYKFERLGITAGASTPFVTIDEIKNDIQLNQQLLKT